MKTFEFNSAICTSRQQSERLLALGLKKETADMCWQTTTLNGEPITYPSQDVWMNGSIITNNHFPAWSLHRLMEIMYGGDIYSFVGLTVHDENIGTIYELVISRIEMLIKIDHFNKYYLEEK